MSDFSEHYLCFCQSLTCWESFKGVIPILPLPLLLPLPTFQPVTAEAMEILLCFSLLTNSSLIPAIELKNHARSPYNPFKTPLSTSSWPHSKLSSCSRLCITFEVVSPQHLSFRLMIVQEFYSPGLCVSTRHFVSATRSNDPKLQQTNPNKPPKLSIFSIIKKSDVPAEWTMFLFMTDNLKFRAPRIYFDAQSLIARCFFSLSVYFGRTGE